MAPSKPIANQWKDGWKLDVKCVDNAGNVFSRTKSVNGVVDDAWDAVSNLAGTIVDFGQWIWNKATGAAAKAADRVADLASSRIGRSSRYPTCSAT